MTVPTSDSREQYEGNDLATEFDYAFKIFDADDLVVILTATDGTETTLLRGTDYSVAGVNDVTGGTVTYPLSGDPLATGETLTILRVIDVVQGTDLRNQGSFYPETLEEIADRSRMIDQQLNEGQSRTLKKTQGASDAYDAGGSRIINVGDHINGGDAMSFGGMKAYFQKLESGELGDTSKVTTPTGADQLLPEALNDRVIHRQALTDLKAVDTSGLSGGEGFRITTTGRAGDFTWMAGDQSANVTNDPQEGVWVAPNGEDGSNGAWERRFILGDGVFSEWFGAVGGGADDTTAVRSAIDYADIVAPTHGRVSVKLGGLESKITTGQLVIDTSLVHLDGQGGTLDFSSHDGSVEFYILYTNTGNISDTYSNPLSGMERLKLIGRGRDIATNNNGIRVESTVGGTVSPAGSTIRYVQIRDMFYGVRHFQSSYNITWEQCSINQNAIGVGYAAGQTDMYERATFNSCTIFNNNQLGFELQAPNGQTYLMGCSLDYNRKHIFVEAGGLEMHGGHIEGTLDDVEHIHIKDSGTFYATGGWWQFPTAVGFTATEELRAENTVKGNIVIENVRFSSIDGPVFTQSPDLVEVINPRPDSSSLLSLKRFNLHNTLTDGLLDSGSFPADSWLDVTGIMSSRYSSNGGTISIMTNDNANAYGGVNSNYLKIDKSFGTGSNVNLRMCVPLHANKRRATVGVRAKNLTASGSISLNCIYATLSPNPDSSSDFQPYDVIRKEVVGNDSITLSSSYQLLSFNMREKAPSDCTHVILEINTFNMGPGELALDDFVISIV